VKKPTESALVRAVLGYLALRKIVAWRVNAGGLAVGSGKGRRFVRLAPAGCGDILAILPPAGRLLSLELKRPGGRLRPSQARWIDLVRSQGGLALVVRSLDELIAALDAEGV
jgi:hypothetical protein